MKTTERFQDRRAFSLIELLVVVAIIALLVGVLAPAMRGVSRISKNLKQKSIFHGFETGLELFSKDFEDYPDSKVLSEAAAALPNLVCGAQHLAEALVGRDEKGFDPLSRWYAPTSGSDVYASTAKGSTADEIDDSLNRRKTPYVELKYTGVFLMEDLYQPTYTGDVFSSDAGRRAPVLVDIFGRRKITVGGQKFKTGTPILYYKANTSSRLFETTATSATDTSKWIYDYDDNKAIVTLAPIIDDSLTHRFADGYTDPDTSETDRNIFYNALTNPKVSFDKPFNAKTFVLMSAGYDGIFGTDDDITNFN